MQPTKYLAMLYPRNRAPGVSLGNQGLFLPLIQLLWCFGMVSTFGCWGCAAGAAGVGATTQLTYKIAQFNANWLPLGVALWSLVLIVTSEALFLWQDQTVVRSLATLLPALGTMWLLYKSVGFDNDASTYVGVVTSEPHLASREAFFYLACRVETRRFTKRKPCAVLPAVMFKLSHTQRLKRLFVSDPTVGKGASLPQRALLCSQPHLLPETPTTPCRLPLSRDLWRQTRPRRMPPSTGFRKRAGSTARPSAPRASWKR